VARKTSAIELSNFTAGLITEASPLNFPENSSLDEQNFVLLRDGSRRRRLGVDLESGYAVVNTSVVVPASGEVVLSTYKWENAGGDPSRTLSVVQVGNSIDIFDTSVSPLSASKIYTQVVSSPGAATLFSFASVDGILVVATGGADILSLVYSSGTITSSTSRLLIRDLFGVGDVVEGVDLRVGSGIATRPKTEVSGHVYNLRNQTWAEPRKILKLEEIFDLVENFFTTAQAFPSNADVTTYSIFPDAQDSGDRLSGRFNVKESVSNPIGTTPAPRGHFIIDALSRGASRLTEINKLHGRYPELKYPVTALPTDATTGGATVLAQYAGRVFYSGFDGTVVGGDDNSPQMSSYVLFSNLVDDPTDINVCYQEGDPTSKEEPDLIDTDGGFIRIDGAYGIVGLVSVSDSLIIIAQNGVWKLQGGSDFGFKATNYSVSKITSYGCSSPRSIALVDTSVMYWGEDGIYVVAKNQFGDYVAENLTQKTIQTYYEAIDSLDRQRVSVLYDSYQRKVVWTYKNRTNSGAGVKQLILDTTLGAFYPFVYGGNKYPMIASGLIVPPYRAVLAEDEVTVSGVVATVSAVPVIVTGNLIQSAVTESAYVTVLGVSPTITYSFSTMSDPDFRDWKSIDGVGADANAFLLTGWSGAGDFQRDKSVPYITFHFIQTENGFEEVAGGDWDSTGKSSCLVRSQWDWTNSAVSGRWGRPFQAYRIKRQYFPASLEDNFDNGFYTVLTKNKLRGKGKVMSMLMETEPYRDCQLLGWSIMLSGNNNV
jgi:hypothetical protein